MSQEKGNRDLWSAEVESRRQPRHTGWGDFNLSDARGSGHVHHLYVLFLCWREQHGKLIVPVTPVITSWFPVNRFVL